jgi:outer membrane receptor protein involved in Fe transport
MPFWLLLCAAVPLSASQVGPGPVSGRVVDAAGAPVVGATVTIASSAPVRTGADGRFTLTDLPAVDVLVEVSAAGFATASRLITEADRVRPVRIVLQPAPFTAAVTVRAAPATRPLDAAESAFVLNAADLLTDGAATLDDSLRAVPGFSLFRRSSSRVANPTTQGASLRGLSASGASRALVLADGVSLNDPFGGWVYWDRIPLAAIDRVEVLRGAGGDRFGTDALGGVIQIQTVEPGGKAAARVLIEGGSLDTFRGSALGGLRRGPWSGVVWGEHWQTGGYTLVAPDERGPVDRPANSRANTVGGSVSFARPAGWSATGRWNTFGEHRNNGTPLQLNDTGILQGSASVNGFVGGGALLVTGAASSEDYDQTFSAVSDDRTTERLTSVQHTSSEAVTAEARWLRPAGRHTLSLAAGGRQVLATHLPARVVNDVELPPDPAGGRERSGNLSAQVNLAPGASVSIDGGVRAEWWQVRSRDGTVRRFGLALPRLSASWEFRPGLTLRGALSRGFRAPTLNELYRGFRVGDTLTQPNANLDPERATTVEASVLLARSRATARMVLFHSALEDPIANVTVSTSPVLIVRQRRNAGAIRASGIELDVELRPRAALAITAGGTWLDSRFRDSPDPVLDGKRVPQVPRYSVSVGLRYELPAVASLSAQLRVVGDQFEDDLNTLLLRAGATIDLLADRRLARGLFGYVAVENLFDVQVDVGRTPVRTVGLPRTVRAGFRLFLP